MNSGRISDEGIAPMVRGMKDCIKFDAVKTSVRYIDCHYGMKAHESKGKGHPMMGQLPGDMFKKMR